LSVFAKKYLFLQRFIFRVKEYKMDNRIKQIFSDSIIVSKIQTKLPKLFQAAEHESSRAGKVGMEVGSLRERIIVALMIFKFGENNVETEIPIT
jgi:hypothetical protein